MHENKTGPMWAAMELKSSLSLSPVSILSSSLPSNLSLQHLGPVIRNSLKIWLQFRKHFHFNQPITLLPLVRNHLFPPSQVDTPFDTWHCNGLVFFKDLFVDGTFASFDLLQKDNDIPKNHFFRYLQVRSFAKKHFPFPQLNVEARPQWKEESSQDLPNVARYRPTVVGKYSVGMGKRLRYYTTWGDMAKKFKAYTHHIALHTAWSYPV